MPLANGGILIDDSYNANPGSVAAAIESLVLACALDKKISVLVLGDMAELGESAENLHAQIGALSKSRGIQKLYACGKFSQATCSSFGDGAMHFNNQPELTDALKKLLGPQHRVLIKGSRSSQMDQVVSAIHNAFGLKENSNAS